MDRAQFEAMLRQDGYEIVARDMAPNTVNPDHTHDFDARILATAGAITLVMGGERRTYGPGEWCAVPAGTVHAEEVGPSGASYTAGRRQPAA